jgi:hypothetical protein
VNGALASSFNAWVYPALTCLDSTLSPWKVTVTGRVAVLSRARSVSLGSSFAFLGVAAVDSSLVVCLVFLLGVASTLASNLVFC